MLIIDDHRIDAGYFDGLSAQLDAHPELGGERKLRVAARIDDPAFSLGLCLHLKRRGCSYFPLPVDAPRELALARARAAHCDALLFGTDGSSALESVEVLRDESRGEQASTEGFGLLQTSSGTTGRAKIIERSWNSIEAEVRSYARHFEVAESWTPIVSAPVNHSYGLISGVLVALARGLEPVVLQNANPKLVLRKMAEFERPLLYSSPTLLETTCLLARGKNALFAVMTSGTLMHQRAFETVRSTVTHFAQQYGCSEAGCVTLGTEIEAPHDLGRPLPHLEIEAGRCSSEPRPILVAGGGASPIETGDLGYFEGGRLHFVSRLDDMINVAGLNVYPAEVEDVVLDIPEVTDAIVFKRTTSWGHEQVALHFVATQPLEEHRLREWCAKHLSSYQIPMAITQVTGISKLPNGKVNRRRLAEA